MYTHSKSNGKSKAEKREALYQKPIADRPKGKSKEPDPQLRLTFVNDGENDVGFLCYGCIQLLEGIDDCGSLSKAAKDMGMAYSKALTMLRDAEHGFGYKLFDGDVGYGSVLTPMGKKLLVIYKRISEETKARAQDIIKEMW